MVFVGNKAGQPSSDVVRVRDPAWDGAAHSGKLFQPNMWVHNQVDTNSVVLVALLEEGQVLLTLVSRLRWQVYTPATRHATQRIVGYLQGA